MEEGSQRYRRDTRDTREAKIVDQMKGLTTTLPQNMSGSETSAVRIEP